VERAGLDVRGGVTVDAVTRDDGGGFTVRTAGGGTLRARRVLLAIGRRGVPRKLGVPGEEGPNVVYRLVDARQYRGRAVVVVGGGDSALEAALSIAAEPDTRVLLSYRGDSFRRARAANRDALAPAVAAGRLRVELTSDVVRIGLDRVVLKTARGEEDFAAAGGVYVIVQAGGVLPDAFLAACGVRIETHHGD
jgi:thioredoxin reductase